LNWITGGIVGMITRENINIFPEFERSYGRKNFWI
jgi:hypothetical protein